MNAIWLILLCGAVLVGALSGRINQVTGAAFSSAESAVTIALGLIGIMTLWLGILKVAEEAGMIRLLARLIRPLSRRLFPQVPPDHPAMGAMLLNISANWLGLGNAATPLGIKAMEHLQELNDDKERATDAMILFLALNTASITLVPMTIIAVRASLGSAHPAEIIGPTILSSLCATLAAIAAVKLFVAGTTGTGLSPRVIVKFIFALLLAAVLVILILRLGRSGYLPSETFKTAVGLLSTWAIPALLFIIPLMAVFKRVRIYEVFIEGAKEGFQVAVRLIPFLVALLVAIGMFRASGALEFLVRLLSPITNLIGMPAEVLPAALVRPLSGSGALGVITELLETHGPDSFIGRLASTLYGCTETTFYVIAVYFGSVDVKKIRYAVPAGLIADAAGILAALLVCRAVFN